MPKPTLATALFCLGAISIAAVRLAASGSDEDNVISFKGNINWAWATRLSTAVHAEDPDPAKRTVIFSNLGPKDHSYEDTVAWDVAGPDSGAPQQWVAMPFTPTFDAEVTQISVAVEHNTGSPNSFVLSLNEDNGGLPGEVIRGWIVSNAPKFETCCTLDNAKDIKSVMVTKGTQYWVVAKTNTNEEATRMEWDLSPQGIEGHFGFNNGQGWYEYTAFTSAFAIYGRRIH
jgi:hypothetical protein